jgi:DNA-binding NtrC family response regulator
MPTTLLFVDDHPTLAKVTTQFMGEIRPEWQFLVARTCAEARMKFYFQGILDAAVVDVDLPDGNGLDLLTEFLASRPKLPVIIISGNDPVALHQEVIARGGHSFFSKPFSVLAIVDNIEMAISTLRGKPQATAARLPEAALKHPFDLIPRSTRKDIVVYDPKAAASNWLFFK